MLTDAQREAAWLALRGVYGRSSMDADRALTALDKAGFVLLHRDDVTEERQQVFLPPTFQTASEERRLVTDWKPADEPCLHCKGRGLVLPLGDRCETCHGTGFVTRWEPITNTEDTDA